MRKIKYLFLIFLSLSLSLPMFLQAQDTVEQKMIMPSLPDEGTFGQNHYYSVVFDGEGEAAVAAKLMLQNNSKDEITSTIVEIPGVGIRMIRAVQEVYQEEEYCLRWEKGECVSWGKRIRRWNPKYYTLEPQAEELSNSVKYTFELAKSLEEQEESALLLYYKVPKAAKKSWGVFHFVFETAKVPYDVNQIRVAVNVQEGFYLRGGKAKTQYRPTYEIGFKALSPQAEGVESQALRDFSQQITYIQGYVKTTSGLDPWESFKVKGTYASSRFLLYKGAIIGWILGTLVFLGSLVWLIWFLIKRFQKKEALIGKTIKKEHLLPLKIIGSGIGSAIGIILIMILGSFLASLISRHLYYQYTPFVSLFLVLVLGILILVFLFGPPLYFGIKYGAAKGVWVIGVTILTLIILGGLMVLFLSMFWGGGPPIYRPMIEKLD